MSEATPPPENTTPPGGSTPPGPPPAQQPAAPSPYSSTPPPPPPAPGAGGYGAPVAATGGNPLLDRFVAKLLDFILLVIVLTIVNVVVLAAIFTSGGGGAAGFGFGSTYGAFSIATAVITTVVYVGYFSFMESSQGKTLGKMVMKIHVEGANGQKPTMEEAVKRNLWLAYPILGVIPFLGIIGGLIALVATILIAVQINSDPEHRPFTDKFAGTRVVKDA